MCISVVDASAEPTASFDEFDQLRDSKNPGRVSPVTTASLMSAVVSKKKRSELAPALSQGPVIGMLLHTCPEPQYDFAAKLKSCVTFSIRSCGRAINPNDL